jgi:hypothetical protein
MEDTEQVAPLTLQEQKRLVGWMRSHEATQEEILWQRGPAWTEPLIGLGLRPQAGEDQAHAEPDPV